jgi:hypothetical protein
MSVPAPTFSWALNALVISVDVDAMPPETRHDLLIKLMRSFGIHPEENPADQKRFYDDLGFR